MNALLADAGRTAANPEFYPTPSCPFYNQVRPRAAHIYRACISARVHMFGEGLYPTPSCPFCNQMGARGVSRACGRGAHLVSDYCSRRTLPRDMPPGA